MLTNEPIDDMLAIGAVTPRSVRIWTRVNVPGRYTVCWSPADGGPEHILPITLDDRARDLTGALTIDQGLEPNARYRVALQGDAGATLATGSFRTAPEDGDATPLHFSIAVMSCHQPFSANGDLSPASEPMLEAVHRAFETHQVRAVIMGGDQLYSDYPEQASLLDPEHFRKVAPPGRDDLLACSSQEVRDMFHQRYRHFWNVKGWRALLANYPCYPILDDHEIVDNWGSAEEHMEDKWQAFRDGAFRAYADYQGVRVRGEHADPPEHFDYQIELADTATYVMDLRSNRRVGEHPQLVSSAQIRCFGDFLRRHRHRHVLFVVLSVPALHLPRSMTRIAANLTPDGEDFSDRWSSRGHRKDRDKILRMLHDHQTGHPEQRLVLLSGDIHIGCLHEVRWKDRQPNLYQFVSSGVTHDAGRFVQGMSSAIIRANREIKVAGDGGGTLTAKLRLLRGEPGARSNPCGRLNVGIVELQRETPTAAPTLRFLLYSHHGAEPRCLYRSPALSASAR